MQSSRENSRIPTARKLPRNNKTVERPKRTAVIPSTSNLTQDPDYIVRQADAHQLLEFLREIGIYALEEDLIHPNPIRIRQIFELLLFYFVPYRKEVLESLKKKAALEFVDLPELGVEIVEAVAVFKEMRHFLNQIRYTDIKLTDFLSPTPPRLQRILSALWNFNLFRESAYEQFERIAKETEKLTDEYEELATEKATLESRISEAESQTELERNEVQEWQSKNQEAEQILRQLRIEGDQILQEIEHCKTERHQLKDSLQELQYIMLNAIEYVKQLKQYETWDVEALRKDIEELAAAMQRNTEEMNKLEQEYPGLEKSVAETKALSNNLSKWIQTMESVNNIRGDTNRHKKTNEAIKKEQVFSTTLQKELKAKISNVSKTLAIQDSRIQSLMEQREKKRESMDQYFKDLEEKKRVTSKEIESATNEKNKCDLQIKEIQDKCNEAYAEHKTYMESIRSQIQDVFAIINDTYIKSMKYE